MAGPSRGKRKEQAKSDAAASPAAVGTTAAGTSCELCKAALQHFDVQTPVKYALRPAVRQALEAGAADDQEAVFTDAEWFQLAEADFQVTLLLLHTKNTLESAAFEMIEPPRGVQTANDADNIKPAKKAQANGVKEEQPHAAFDWPFASQFISASRTGLMAARAALNAHMAARVEASKTAGALPPRFDRLVAKLGTTAKETAALRFILHKQTMQADWGVLASRKLGGGPNFSPATYSGMDTLEVLEFVRPARKHVKEGLIPESIKAFFVSHGDQYEYVYGGAGGGAFSTDSLHLASEVVKALMGEVLTAEELLKLDKTTLMEVLEEEPGFLASQKSIGGGAAMSTPTKPALFMEGLQAEGDLFELIKQEVQRDTQRDTDTRKRSLSDIIEDEQEGQATKKARPASGQTDPMEADAEGTAAAAGTSSGPDVAASEMPGSSTPAREAPAADRLTSTPGAGSEKPADEIREYRTDLEYLEDSFKLLITLLRVAKLNRVMALDESEQSAMEDEGMYYDRGRRNPKTRATQQLRELEGRERLDRSRIERRLHLTSLAGDWRPRLERLSEARGLAPFERQVLLLLVGVHVSPSVQRTYTSRSGFDDMGSMGSVSVGALLLSFLPVSLQEQISARKYFYKSGRLIKDGIITLSGTDFSRDIMDQGVDVDRRMLDFLVGLDTEFSDLVDGSHLYYPGDVALQDVVLPDEQKSLITETVENFAAYKKVRKALEEGGSSATGGGNGLCLLFHGPSGVGKTMMANACARHVQKKVLLINFPSLGNNEAGETIRFIFREAKIHDAITFFDEAEGIFEDRELRGSRAVNLLLTELEKHDGISILATNRPQELDEAMHRRITMSFEFRKPDHVQRQLIWRRQLPPKVKLEEDVDITALALKFELSGGYIRNAVQAALSRSTARGCAGPEDVRLCQADLLHGAKLQLRGALRMKDFDRRRVPTRGLDDVLVSDELKGKLDKVVQHEKARAVLIGQWGFSDLSGTVCLFSGPPGTGKTLAAEAIGFETGKPLKIVNCGGLVSKWVGDTPKNIDALFQEARAMDAILVFDEAESLFGSRADSMSSSTDRYASMDVGVLLQQLENTPGVVVLITNKPKSLDTAFQRRIRFELEFAMPPPSLRAKLWRIMLPKQAPLGKVDFEQLGRSYELAGGSIKNAVVRAATRAALRMSTKDGGAQITMEDLVDEAKEEAAKGGGSIPVGMYN